MVAELAPCRSFGPIAKRERRHARAATEQPAETCTCNPAQIQRYISKISGLLLDRADIQLEIPAVPMDELQVDHPSNAQMLAFF